MYAVERLSSYITRGVYTVSGPFHPFGGAVDIIVVQQQDGSFKSSPWNVRFGKFQGVLKTKEKVVNICINGTDAKFHMYLDHKGEAYFLRDDNQNEGESFMSPPSSGDEIDGHTKNGRLRNAQSFDCDESHRESVQFNMGHGKIVPRMNSRGHRIFGFVFGTQTLKESGNGGNVEPVSSLEHAEIAADLLEVKWSTNLSTNDRKGKNSLKLLSDGDGQVGNAVDTVGRFSMESSDFGLIHDDKIISHHEEISDNTENNILAAGHIDKTSCLGYPDLRTFEEVIEIYSSETGVLADENAVLSSSLNAVEFDLSFKESVTVNPIVDLCTHNFHILSSDKDSHLTADASGAGSEDTEVSSFFYSETSESPNAVHDVSCSAALEALGSFYEKQQEKINAEHVHDKASEENLHELWPLTVKENSDKCSCDNLELNNHMDYMQINGVTGGASKHPVAANVEWLTTDSLSLHDVSFLSSQSIETETVDATWQDKLKGGIVQEMVTDPDLLWNSGKLCEMDGCCPVKPCHSIPGFNVDQTLSSIEEAKSQSICVPAGSSDTVDEVQKPYNPTENVKFDKCDFPGDDIIVEESGSSFHLLDVGNGGILSSESVEEDHFLFNEIHKFGSNGQPGQLVTAEEIEAADCPSVAPEGNLEDNESADTSHSMCCADISEASQVQTSPISILKPKRSPEEKEQEVGSLPNIHSHVHDLEMSDVHQPNNSLLVKSMTSAWGMPETGIPSSPDIESTSESNLLQSHPISDNALVIDHMQRIEGQNDVPINPAVEISLCKHLLFEGMGAEAASKVFDAEKVDLEKFAALGPSLVKNDKLVIRIGSRYFPWNAAAPIILGIASFNHEGIFDAEGMIAVDQTDKTPEEDTSSAIVPSGGTWRLWPFNFKTSRSMNSLHLASNGSGITEKETETGSMDNEKLCNDSVQEPRILKKKVRSVTPTSEQLASLNLKEGQNLVTFSFSTSMLGKQQVDARIYLWKWNTRIVVSDVDGTITKSDVLGQFMPLVGKDWSQTGVAHLFSAIKENGYQLLFLSARAISQAYLTRQFLFNLKQDGKALPDGPVVISPDGLFPSLYREVIRRAPHEFKISCLEEIQALFPTECNPFYAGFGNRDTDEISYLKVGIPRGKIFIINPKGEVVVNHRVDRESYTSLHGLVNAIFPAMPSAEQENFNSWNYWKLPLPDINT